MNPMIRAAHSCAPGPPRAATSCTKNVTGAVVCRLTGDMDPDSASAVAQALLSVLGQARGPHELFVDLAEVRYLSAGGLAALLKVREAAVGARVRLVLFAPQPAGLPRARANRHPPTVHKRPTGPARTHFSLTRWAAATS
jgi:anti-anti-sigma factor